MSERGWVFIEPGWFLMGAQSVSPERPAFDEKACDDEAPVHRVRLDAYWIAPRPATVSDYRAFVDAGGYTRQELWSGGGFARWSRPQGWEEQLEHPDRPVTGVSWFEATAFAAWRGCRLPTEAQWERAARGVETRRYPWGDEPAPAASLFNAERVVGHPTPAGAFPGTATPEGIEEMAGNVWEWCLDWFGPDYYAVSPEIEPTGPRGGEGRVIRGGSWRNTMDRCRAAFRTKSRPDWRDANLGLRLVAAAREGPGDARGPV